MKHAPSLFVSMFLLAGCNGATAPLDSPASANPRTKEKTTVSNPSNSDADKSDKPNSEKVPSNSTAKFTANRVIKSEAEWKKILTAEQFRVLRKKGTERPYVNEFDHHFEPGSYSCAACGQVLFESDTKFNSGCGWPAFYAAKAKDRVNLHVDRSHGMVRTEVTCSRCDSHLGHIFDDAPKTPTGQRYCINSVSIKFTPAEKEKDKVKDETKEPPAKK